MCGENIKIHFLVNYTEKKKKIYFLRNFQVHKKTLNMVNTLYTRSPELIHLLFLLKQKLF